MFFIETSAKTAQNVNELFYEIGICLSPYSWLMETIPPFRLCRCMGPASSCMYYKLPNQAFSCTTEHAWILYVPNMQTLRFQHYVFFVILILFLVNWICKLQPFAPFLCAAKKLARACPPNPSRINLNNEGQERRGKLFCCSGWNSFHVKSPSITLSSTFEPDIIPSRFYVISHFKCQIIDSELFCKLLQ